MRHASWLASGVASLALLGGAGFLQAADKDTTSRPAADASALPADDSYKHVFHEPFWNSTKMDCEPVFFVKDKGQDFATAKLLFVPAAPPALRSPDLATVYEPGKDFTWKSGSNVIELLKDSRIPFKTVEEMSPPKGAKNTLQGVLWSEGHFFHDLQPQASYEHAGLWTWQPTASEPKLARSITKLKEQRAFKVVAIGDSITEGYNASGFKKVAVPPRQPAYPELLALLLERHFGSAVSLKNLGIAGTKADRAFTQLEQLKSERPDLVTIAYGMNHGERPELFEATMRKLLAAVREAVPDADVVLVSSMTQRLPATKFIGYRDVLLQMAGENVAVADVTTPWIELLKTKSFTDISGNNFNHPNDFGHRLYALVIFQLFTMV